MVLVIARTVAHLFRQMREQGRPLPDLELVHRAYGFGMALHSARFEVDGTPFHVHGLGVASVMAQLDAPASVVAAATLHNAYTTGDWGDGRGNGVFPNRLDRLRVEVGDDVESYLTRLREARSRRHLDHLLADATADVDDASRWLGPLDLADLLDKWDDGRISYSDHGRGDRAFVEGRETDVVALAARLGGAELAAAFDSAFARIASDDIPDSLRRGRRYSDVVLPPSSRPRISVAMRRRARRFARRLQGRRPRRETAG